MSEENPAPSPGELTDDGIEALLREATFEDPAPGSESLIRPPAAGGLALPTDAPGRAGPDAFPVSLPKL